MRTAITRRIKTGLPRINLTICYEEADDGSSERDSLAKKKISLRELKETRFRLKVLQRCGFLTEAQDPVIIECDELVRIVATVIRNAGEIASRSPMTPIPLGVVELGVGGSATTILLPDLGRVQTWGYAVLPLAVRLPPSRGAVSPVRYRRQYFATSPDGTLRR